MNGHNPEVPPDPEELAAYRDGELPPGDRQRIEEWLSDHADAAAEVDSWQRLHALWQSATPPEPTEANWARVRQGIQRGLTRTGPVRTRSWTSRGKWWAAAAGAAAALIVLTATLARWHTPLGEAPATVEPFPVASNEDVEIISIDAAGVAALVVGDLPLRNPIVLMGPGDIALKSVARGREGSFPEVRLQPDTEAAPMILGPVAAGVD
jgi:anti-sigma-K factor RskA